MNNRFPIDVIEEDEAYRLIANLPGISNDQVEVKVDHESVEIVVNVEQSAEEKYLHQERAVGQFRRRLSFGRPIKSSDATTTLRNGVLEVVLPYTESAKKVKLLIN